MISEISTRFKLGCRHNKGIGLEVNKEKIYELYKIAAEKRHSEAQNSLGLLYEKVEGKKKNSEKVFFTGL